MRHFAATETCGNYRTATPPPGCGGGRHGFAGRVGGDFREASRDTQPLASDCCCRLDKCINPGRAEYKTPTCRSLFTRKTPTLSTL